MLLICEQRMFGRACALAQSRQNLYCLLTQIERPYFLSMSIFDFLLSECCETHFHFGMFRLFCMHCLIILKFKEIGLQRISLISEESGWRN